MKKCDLASDMVFTIDGEDYEISLDNIDPVKIKTYTGNLYPSHISKLGLMCLIGKSHDQLCARLEGQAKTDEELEKAIDRNSDAISEITSKDLFERDRLMAVMQADARKRDERIDANHEALERALDTCREDFDERIGFNSDALTRLKRERQHYRTELESWRNRLRGLERRADATAGAVLLIKNGHESLVDSVNTNQNRVSNLVEWAEVLAAANGGLGPETKPASVYVPPNIASVADYAELTAAIDRFSTSLAREAQKPPEGNPWDYLDIVQVASDDADTDGITGLMYTRKAQKREVEATPEDGVPAANSIGVAMPSFIDENPPSAFPVASPPPTSTADQSWKPKHSVYPGGHTEWAPQATPPDDQVDPIEPVDVEEPDTDCDETSPFQSWDEDGGHFAGRVVDGLFEMKITSGSGRFVIARACAEQAAEIRDWLIAKTREDVSANEDTNTDEPEAPEQINRPGWTEEIPGFPAERWSHHKNHGWVASVGGVTLAVLENGMAYLSAGAGTLFKADIKSGVPKAISLMLECFNEKGKDQ